MFKLKTSLFISQITVLAITLSACSGLGLGSPAGKPELPQLPIDDMGRIPPTKRSSTHDYSVDLSTPATESGSNNRVDAPGYVLADNAAPPWAMFAVAMSDDERPVSMALQVTTAPVQSGGNPQPLSYWVGVSDYSALKWQWRGPFAANATIPLNNETPGSPSERRVSGGNNFYFVVTAASPAGPPGGPAAMKIVSASVNTQPGYIATLPHAVVCTTVQGNTKNPPGTDDAHAITIEWTSIDPVDAFDEQNTADSYTVYRKNPSGSVEQLGIVSYPETQFLDPGDNKTGALPPQPGATYIYSVVASNEQGSAQPGNHSSIQCPDPVGSSVWREFRANPQRTGSVGSVVLSGTLSQNWEVPLAPAASQNTYEPLISDTNDLLIVNGSHVNQYAISDGAKNLEKGSFGPIVDSGLASRLGDLMAFPDEASGIQTVNLGGGASKTFTGTGRVKGAPLLLGTHCVFADKGGSVSCYDTNSGEQVWQYTGTAPFTLAPASDYNFVYAVDDDGLLLKLNAGSGAVAGQVSLGSAPVGESLALDSTRHLLWVVTMANSLVCVATGQMTVGHVWAPGGGNTGVAPCVLYYNNPPMVVTAWDAGSTIAVMAVNESNLQTMWTTQLNGTKPNNVSASADELLVCRSTFTGDEVAVVSLAGAETQALPLGDDTTGSAVPIQGKLVVATKNDPYLRLFKTAAITPPVWQDPGQVGIQGWGIDSEDHNGRDDIRASWYTAIHPDNLSVHYALFYSTGHAPMLEAPYTDTTVVSGLTIGDSNTVQAVDVPLGERLYASVRAYVGTWGVDAVVETNTNVIACTPPWDEGVVYTSGSTLPGGQTGQFAAVFAEDIQRAYMVATGYPSGQMWAYWEAPGGFGYEGAWINSYQASAVAASWYNQFFAARAKAGTLSVFQRNSLNDWTDTGITGRNPDPTPAVALVMNDQSAVAWTEKISGVEPTTVVNYYAARNDGTGWGASEVVDSANVGGSDLALALDPNNHAKPWLAYERGTAQASTLPTCTKGELWFAKGDGGGGYTLELVDAGANAPNSDCGKRVRMRLDSAGYPHLAYLDLNAAVTEPKGRLKYAYQDLTGWHIENVASFDLSHQTGDAQFTYGQIGLELEENALHVQEPRIALLERQDYDPSLAVNNTVIARVFSKSDGIWTTEQVSDPQPVLLKDREPCDLMFDQFGYLTLCYIAQPPQSTAQVGTQIIRLRRVN